MRTLLAAVFCVASTAALAQQQGGDEWNSFPPTPPIPSPGSTPPPTATPTPAPTPAPEATQPVKPPPPPNRKQPPADAPTATPAAATPAPTPDVSGTPTIPTGPAAAQPAPGMAPESFPGTARTGTPTPEIPASTGAAPAAPATAAEPEPPPDGSKVVSTKERFVPGTEPHSPSTWGNTYNDIHNHRDTSSSTGGVGLLHMQSAQLGWQGLLRASATGSYFQWNDFPVQSAIDTRTAFIFAASYVPLDWLEAYIGYAGAANTNSTSSPPLISTMGDLTLGAKASKKWAKGFWAGGDLRLLSFSGVGNQDVGRAAFGISPQLIGTYDVREAQPKVPIIAHMNLGFAFDGTGHLVTETQHVLNSAEEFALGVNQFNRFTFAVGVEAPLPVVTPFIEYNLGVPLGTGTLLQPNQQPVSLSAVMPETLTLGGKVTAIRDVTLTLAFDFGLSSSVAAGIPATMPFTTYLTASFNFDPFQRGDSRLVETLRERKVEVAEKPKVGKVEGVITDAQTHKPISGVIVAMVGAGLPPVATDADNGRFLTHELPTGPMKLQLQKDGYKEALQELTIEAGKTEKLEVTLDPLAKNAHFAVTVTSKKKGVAATVAMEGPTKQQVNTTDGAKEPLKVEAPAGKYTVNVTAPGYLAQTREVQVSENAEMQLAFDLEQEPKKKLVVVKENRIEILQPVHFATGKATILADSFALLNQVLDAIVVNGIKRVRVEGHTDNRGQKAFNMKLSEDRAKAVVDYLVKAGIDTARLEGVGYGDTRPVAPNLTARGRELNRRVELIILER